MDFFNGRNYRITKTLLSILGQWPYQSPRTSYILVAVISTIVFTQTITKICALIKYFNDLAIAIECLIPVMIDTSGITKLVNFLITASEIRALYDRVKLDFYTMKNSTDVKILEQYANHTRLFTNVYIFCTYVLLVVYLFIPFQPLLFGVVNATTRPMLFRVEYYIDMDKYYIPIFVHEGLSISICVSYIILFDATFVTFVQHACGLFMLTNVRIERAIEETHTPGTANPPIVKDKPFQNMVQCVHDHKEAMRFAGFIELAYSKHFLFHNGLYMIGMAVTSVAVLVNMNSVVELLRLVAVVFAGLTHLLLESLCAQRLIDNSGHLYTTLITSNWYDASPRTKKLILFMIMKVQPPCVLTAGGMFVLGMDTYATIVKSAVSYFTFLRSAQ